MKERGKERYVVGESCGTCKDERNESIIYPIERYMVDDVCWRERYECDKMWTGEGADYWTINVQKGRGILC